MPTATFPGKYESLADISQFVRQVAESAELDGRDIYAVTLAVEEACANIIDHAYGGESQGDIICTCEARDEALVVILRDHGQPFDPQAVPEPEFKSPLEEIEPGGAGLFLMRKMMDEVVYKFDPTRGNTLTMVKKIPS